MKNNSTSYDCALSYRGKSSSCSFWRVGLLKCAARGFSLLLFTLCLFSLDAHAQHVLRGKVVDEKNEPLIGATVIIKGTTSGSSTDYDGRFVMEVPTAQTVLQISYLGYETMETPAGAERDRTFSLKPDQAKIGEVVVVGFGVQEKESMVSSVATVKGEQLRMPTRNLSNNLAGQVAGMIAVQRSGEPGYDNSEFFIRGMSTFAGSNSPLVLVDGVPRSLYDIEPDEIETLTLLKDATATAIYGAEGANGVLLITSKRGKAQKTTITYRGETSIQSPTRAPRYANSYDYLRLYNEALVNEGGSPVFSDDILEKYRTGEDPDLYPNSNWWDIIMREHTWNTRHTLNFRGGGERFRFFTSGAYFQESGYYKVNPEFSKDNGLKRYNLRNNVDIDVTKTTLLRVDLAGQYVQTTFPGFGANTIFERISRIPPHLFPARYSNGMLGQHPQWNGNKTSPYVAIVESGYAKEWRTMIQSRVDLEQKLDFITEGLKIRGAASYDADGQFRATRGKTPNTYNATGRDADGNLILTQIQRATPFGEPGESNSASKRIYLESALDYKRKIGKHDINALALYYQKENQLHNNALAYRTMGMVGRVTYAFDNRYSIEGSFGSTGSENFAKGYRFGFFPAVGVAWNVANEAFFPEALKSTFQTLKFRGSIGRTGNDDILGDGNRFPYRPTFNTNAPGYSWGIGSSGALNSIGGINEGKFASPFLSWEIEMKRNIGIDLTMWNGRVSIVADYFNNHRSNILMQRRTISGVAGFRESPFQNFGQVTNKGFDGSIELRHTIGDWTFSGRGNYTFARNRITEIDEIPQVHEWMNVTGTRLNSVGSMLIAERLFEESDFDVTMGTNGKKQYTLKEGIATKNDFPNPLPGDIKYKDLNNDGVVDDFDRTIDQFDPYIPEIIYGFGLNVMYKGFYGSVFFQGADNVTVNLNNQANAFMPFHWGLTESNVRQEIVESRWTEENPSQDVFFPRLRQQSMGNTNTLSTWWLRDGAFLRLKNVEFGYNFGPKVLALGRMKAARIYLMGQNVTVWDEVQMYDPELGNSAGGTRYPLPRMWTGGLEVTF
ncbi:SusC/RagA family TonB-linked outer membrane protein [Rufibacter roseus]|uniref:SusC/RagA family TonB-linked outer membrane protein n=1 Tax=Rufibacter roseus TaxID=1567108 RepID=A0ABW2DRD6_9BACT|nr:TonB-dependent receptor [Rufibacter roseus]